MSIWIWDRLMAIQHSNSSDFIGIWQPIRQIVVKYYCAIDGSACEPYDSENGRIMKGIICVFIFCILFRKETFAMNIQDIQYITDIAAAGSIGKAANKLHVAQPSLSKCIQKIEKEYNITLFTRVKGVSVKLTPEGELFIKMADKILLSHSRFQEQLKRLQELQKNSLSLGLTYQRTVDLAEPILERFYLNNSKQILQIVTRDSAGLQQGILDKSLDFAVMAVLEKHKDIYYEIISSSYFGVYLREGSRIADKAFFLEGIDYPVVRLEDLEGERFTVNTPGSASRSILEELLRKNNTTLEIIDVMNNQSRMAMVSSGIANAFVPIQQKNQRKKKNDMQIYIIHPDQNIYYDVCLACLKGFQTSEAFKTLYTVLKELI